MIIDPIDKGIEMIAGDTEAISLSFVSGAENIEFAAGDKVVLSVKRDPSDEDYVLQVEALLFPEAEPLTIQPEMTQNLQEGTYWYDIKMTTSTLGVKTLVWPTIFEIKRGITNE